MEEHVASERPSRSLAAIMETMPSTEDEPVCLLACATGEMHTLGLSFLQLCLKEAGWRPLWIGASTPMDELYAVAASGEVQAIAVSASEHASDPGQLAEFATLIGAACEASGTALMLGGSGSWPEPSLYGTRFRAFTPFAEYIRELG